MSKTNLVKGLIILVLNMQFFFNPDNRTLAASVSQQAGTSMPGVTLRSRSGRTIEFQTQNGMNRNGIAPETHEIPVLTLFSNDRLARANDRTLIVEVTGIQVPSSGATLSLKLETQRGEPLAESAAWPRITAWQETRHIPAPAGTVQSGTTLTFTHTFTETILSAGKRILTPTDYYRYEIIVTGDAALSGTTLYTITGEYAFLLENLWTAALPDAPEATRDAAPDELVIYYCDMVPFQRNIHDASTWLARRDVRDFVGSKLLPAMLAAFHVQSDHWAFPWYQAWTSYRGGEDAERISVALTDGATWFHGSANPRGGAGISINVSGGDNANYASLADGVMSTFHHELFHNQQKNIHQYLKGNGSIDGTDNQWQFFTEGTAVLASSVAQTDIQFAHQALDRAYMINANLYLGSDTIRGDIGRDFSAISPYHAAIYWRFLYEHCGGMQAGVEKPTAGMQIVRRALASLYQAGQRNLQLKVEDLIGTVMDQALSGSTCPFQTYRQSLVAFAQAIDALGQTGGRCQRPGLPEGCGFYDPYKLYHVPPTNAAEFLGVSP